MKDKSEKTFSIDSAIEISPYGDTAEQYAAERDRSLDDIAKALSGNDPKPAE